MSTQPESVTFDNLSGLWQSPLHAKAMLVFAHGAGVGMTHNSMNQIADGLAARDIASLRFNFAYMERGSKRPDSPTVAHAAIRSAVAEATKLSPDLPMFAGGRSFGGRMTSQAQAIKPLPGVRGLVFVAFPLHPAGKPAIDRADHLAEITVPMLFLQGTRDALAELELLGGVVEELGPGATLVLSDEADHSFHVPAKTGRNDAKVLDDVLDAASDWILANC